MFQTAIKKEKVFDYSTTLGVFSLDLLMKEDQYVAYFKKVRKLAGGIGSRYETCYLPLLSNYCEFVQLLPLSSQGGLGEALRRGLLTALHYLSSFVEDDPAATEAERFALYSYALCRQLGDTVVNHRVVATDRAGRFRFHWNPYKGSLLSQKASYYRLLPPGKAIYQSAVGPITVVLARQLLPEEAYFWLSSPDNIHLFTEWLLLLAGEESDGIGRLGHVVTRYRQEILDLLLDELPLLDEIEQLENEDLEIAAEFLDWLEEKIAKGELDVNNVEAGLHVTDTGFLIEAWVFKQFTQTSKHLAERMSRDVHNVVFQQLGNLFGLVELSGIDFRVKQFFSKNQSSSRMSAFRNEGPSEQRSGVVLPVALSNKGESVHIQANKRQVSLSEVVRNELSQAQSHKLR